MLNCVQIGAGAFQHSQKATAPEFTGTTEGGTMVYGVSESFHQ